jgi:hypothetical protein
MSKAKEAIEPESARKSAEGGAEPNGLIVPVPRSADDLGSALEVDTDLDMEVDDEYQQFSDELEIQWCRQPNDGRSTYQSLPPQRRPLRSLAFDAVSA